MSTNVKRTEEAIEEVHGIVNNDWHVTITELADMTVLGRAALNYALYENLGLSRKAASWVPHNLSEELKQMPINIAKGFMKLKEGMLSLIHI